MESDQQHASGLGTKYFTKARSAYAIACNSATTKQMIIQPELAFSHAAKNQVAMLADLSQEQIRNLILHHRIPVPSEPQLNALSGLFQLAHYCHTKNLLKEMAELNLSVKCDRYWYPTIALTQQINNTIKAKKECKMLAYKLRRIQRLTSRLVTSTQAFGDILNGVADLSRIEEMDTDDDEDDEAKSYPTIAALL